MEGVELRSFHLPLGDRGVQVLVTSEDERPQTVLMSFDGFLEVCGALFVAVEALEAAGVEPDDLARLTAGPQPGTNGQRENGFGDR